MTQSETGAGDIPPSAQEILARAVDAARENVLHENDAFLALQEISRATVTLREAADEFSHLRAVFVATMIENQKGRMSQTKLAKMIGVSKARIGQLNAVGRRILDQ